ncbi:hypothetical protein, partial [Pseudomonas aeruginosa]|uniref:hypothetical protein n=1 Tax=Pseudomonas aeruginosa TaxID=287 RepID=UPI001C544104
MADKIPEQTPPDGHITIGWSSTAYVDAKQVVQDIESGETPCPSGKSIPRMGRYWEVNLRERASINLWLIDRATGSW